jgi:hypothetical protein
MSDSTSPGGAEQPPTRDDRQTAWMAGAARTAAATAVGALAGAAAGMGTMIVGPVGTVVGAIIGAEIMEMGSQATGAEPSYSPEHDEHYRALWESDPARPADTAFETVRPAYRFGHVAAFQAQFVGWDFVAAESDLRTVWERDSRARHGEWERVRQYVRDAYGHSRGESFGVRRDERIIGSGGSAVDPVELDRARSGLPSVDESRTAGIAYDHPGYAEVNNDNALGIAPAGTGSGGLGEWPETDANTAHRGPGYH